MLRRRGAREGALAHPPAWNKFVQIWNFSGTAFWWRPFFRDHHNPMRKKVKVLIHLEIFWFEHSGRFIVPPQTDLLSYVYDNLALSMIAYQPTISIYFWFLWSTFYRIKMASSLLQLDIRWQDLFLDTMINLPRNTIINHGSKLILIWINIPQRKEDGISKKLNYLLTCLRIKAFFQIATVMGVGLVGP